MIQVFRRKNRRVALCVLLRAGLVALLGTAVTFVGTDPLEAQASSRETEVTGGLYLFHYQPVDLEGGEAHTEVYAAFVDVGHASGPWRVFAQVRARDTRLRDFFPGNVWFQEAWASYRVTDEDAPSSLQLRAGKMYQTLGRFWDGSFFGNVHYFDGLKLNPQFGLEASGRAGSGRVALAWSSQVILGSDRVSGAFQGRDFETLEGFKDQYGVTGRVAASLPGGVTLGISALSRRVEGPGPEGEIGGWRAAHVAADGELRAGPVTLYAEAMRRSRGDLPPELRMSQPGSRATYLLMGAQYLGTRLHLRYNFSRVEYDDLDRREWIHQPGLTLKLADNLSGLFEVNVWKGDEEGGTETLDRSLNFILLLHF